jgi:hypothetical protein
MAHLPNVVDKVTIVKVLLTIVKSFYFDCKTTMEQLKKPLLSIIKSHYYNFKKSLLKIQKSRYYDYKKRLLQLLYDCKTILQGNSHC